MIGCLVGWLVLVLYREGDTCDVEMVFLACPLAILVLQWDGWWWVGYIEERVVWSVIVSVQMFATSSPLCSVFNLFAKVPRKKLSTKLVWELLAKCFPHWDLEVKCLGVFGWHSFWRVVAVVVVVTSVPQADVFPSDKSLLMIRMIFICTIWCFSLLPRRKKWIFERFFWLKVSRSCSSWALDVCGVCWSKIGVVCSTYRDPVVKSPTECM